VGRRRDPRNGLELEIRPSARSATRIRPVTLRVAQAFVTDLHRHNKAPRGHKLSLGLFDGDRLVGVGVLSRPIARLLDTGINAEITRTCTHGTRNANSQIYGALLRVSKAMGYYKVYTYTQEGECGSSLRAVGFVREAELPPRSNWADSSKKLKAVRDPRYLSGGGDAHKVGCHL
jgi:hypothetical protein